MSRLPQQTPHRFPRSLLTVSLSLAALHATPVWSQASDGTAEQERIQLEAVTVTAESAGASPVTEGTGSYTTEATRTATRLTLAPRETPQSVSVITRQVMDDFAVESITDVVNMTTGVSSKAFDSSRNGFSARGFDITNLMVDGVPTTWSAGWAAGETQMDTLLYDRVEVVRGATGLVTGAGNPSAAINMVRKRADSVQPRGFVSGQVGSWDR